MKPVLTIIVPVYNTEPYLRKCLDSLLIKQQNQLEIIVVIDDSPDNSLTLATEYSDKYPGIFKVINKENGGHGSCCNMGLRLATGKYIRFLDSDDWLETDSLELLVDRLKNTETDVVMTRSVKEFVYNATTEPYGHPFEPQICNQVTNIESIDFHLYEHPFLTLAGCTFLTSMLRATDIRFSEKTNFDDTIIFTHPFIGIKTILFVDLILYHYFIGRPEQSTHNPSLLKFHQIFNETFRAVNVFPVIPPDKYLKCRTQFSALEAKMIRTLYIKNLRTDKKGRGNRRRLINYYVDNCCKSNRVRGLKFLILRYLSSPVIFRIYERLKHTVRK